MNDITNQISMFGTLIKENIWELRLTKTKGNRDRYIYSFECDLDEWLCNIPDRKKVERFKKYFFSSLFDTHIIRGIYDNMNAAEIFGYEFEERAMNSKGVFIFDNWFYKGSYINLKEFEGVFELIINELNDNYIEVTHRFGADKYCRSFNSIDELKDAMWSLDDLKELEHSFEHKSDNELFSLRSMLYKAHHNFDIDNKEARELIDSLSINCSQEVKRRDYIETAKLTEKDFLRLVADNVYNNSWDSIRESIDNDSRQKAISTIARNKNSSGGTFSYKRFHVGFVAYDTKGVSIKTTDERVLRFSWGQVYDSILENKKPKQIDIFSILTTQIAV